MTTNLYNFDVSYTNERGGIESFFVEVWAKNELEAVNLLILRLVGQGYKKENIRVRSSVQ